MKEMSKFSNFNTFIVLYKSLHFIIIIIIIIIIFNLDKSLDLVCLGLDK